jgi:hypothetical protein
MRENKETAYNKLNELLEVHKDHPMTTNHDFVNYRRKLQKKRGEGESRGDMDLVAAEDAFDNMNAYYNVPHYIYFPRLSLLI